MTTPYIVYYASVIWMSTHDQKASWQEFTRSSVRSVYVIVFTVAIYTPAQVVKIVLAIRELERQVKLTNIVCACCTLLYKACSYTCKPLLRYNSAIIDWCVLCLKLFLCRPIITEFGLWDQLRVDCGKEFALILHVQDRLSNFRTNTQRLPFVQTQSKQVHSFFSHFTVLPQRQAWVFIFTIYTSYCYHQTAPKASNFIPLVSSTEPLFVGCICMTMHIWWLAVVRFPWLKIMLVATILAVIHFVMLFRAACSCFDLVCACIWNCSAAQTRHCQDGMIMYR